MTSAVNHQYCLRYGLWHAPCHASAQLAGYEWGSDLANTIPPLIVTPPSRVLSASKINMVVDSRADNVCQWIESECPVDGVILPDPDCFLVGPTTYLNNCLGVVDTPAVPGDVVQVRYRPTFSKLASGEYRCNLVATDVRICSHGADA